MPSLHRPPMVDLTPAKVAVIAAGGTGGHLFPAQALAEALNARGWRVVLATDDRVKGLSESFPAERRIALSAATYRPGDPLGMVKAGFAILRGVMQARAALSEIKPAIVVGFGGYPSLPALLAALSQGRRTVIHEQNAVMGRANRLLAPRVTTVACAFPTLLKAPAAVQARAVVVGNPVRPQIRALADRPYEPPTSEFRLLVTGGSQGARLLSELIPAAVAKLPEAMRARLKVQQQTRAESMDNARKVYDEAMVDCRDRALLPRDGRPAGRRAPGDRPGRRLDGLRDRRRRPALDPGAAEDRPRRRPGPERPPAGRSRRAPRSPTRTNSPSTAWPPP